MITDPMGAEIRPTINIPQDRWYDLCGILDLAPSATLGSVEGELIRMTENYDELLKENKRLREAVQKTLNY